MNEQVKIEPLTAQCWECANEVMNHNSMQVCRLAKNSDDDDKRFGLALTGECKDYEPVNPMRQVSREVTQDELNTTRKEITSKLYPELFKDEVQ